MNNKLTCENMASVSIKALLFSMFIGLGVFLPFLGLVLCCWLLISYIVRSPHVSALIVIIFATTAFCIMNASRGFQGDWNWYTQHYLLLNTLDFSQYYGGHIGRYPIKTSEPVYYFLSYILSRASGANITVLSITITSIIYLLSGYSLFKLVAVFKMRAKDVAFSILIALLFGITFTLTNQLVRQETALGLLFLAFILILSGSHWIGLVLLGVACLTHNSALLPSIAIVIAFFFRQKTIFASRLHYLFLWLFCVLIGVGYVFTAGSSYVDSGRSDGEISLIVFMLDGSLAAFLLYYCLRIYRGVIAASVDEKQCLYRILTVFFLYSGFLVGLSMAPIPFLRMYFYVEIFRTLIVAILMVYLLKEKRTPFFYVMIFLLAILYLYMRIERAPYYYGVEIVDLLFFSPWDIKLLLKSVIG